MKKTVIMFATSAVLVIQSFAGVAASNLTNADTDTLKIDTDNYSSGVDELGAFSENFDDADLQLESGNETEVQSTYENESITVFSDDDVFGKASGSYETDITQNADGNWHILEWLTDKPIFQNGANDYIKDGVKYYYMEPKASTPYDVPFSYVTGGVPEDSAITRFSIDASWINNSAFLKVYAASSLDASDDEWTELTAAENISNGMNGNLNRRITYTMSSALGYRYIKVENTPVRSAPYYAHLGGFSFDWVDPFELRENEVRVKVDGGHTEYVYDKSDSIRELNSDGYGGYLGFENSDNEAYVIYGAPDGKCFKYFYVDIANADDASVLDRYEIGISQKADGNYYPMTFSDAKAEPLNKLDSGSRFEWDEINTRYVKFKIYPGSDYENFKLGTFGFELADYDENYVNELYTFEADTTSNRYSDWGIISVKGPGGLYNWAQYISSNKGEHYFFGGSDGMTTDILIGGIAARNAMREFTVETFYNKNGIEVYAAKEQDGEYVKISEEFNQNQSYTWNEGGSVTKRVFRMRASEGYRYIKLRVNTVAWNYCIGKITYTYGSIDGPEAYNISYDMSNSGDKTDITFTAKAMLEVSGDTSVICLLTTYKDGKLVYAAKQKATFGNTAAEIKYNGVPKIDFSNGDEAQLTVLTYVGDQIKFIIPSKNLEE